MAIFDEKDKAQLSELFRTKEVAKIDPGNQNFEKPNTEIKKPLYETPETKEVKTGKVEGYEEITKDVDYIAPEGFESETKEVQYQEPEEEFTPLIAEVNTEVLEPKTFESVSGVSEAPEGYSSDEKSVIVEPVNGLNNSQPFVVAEPGQDASKYVNKNGVVRQTPNPYQSTPNPVISETPPGYTPETNQVVVHGTPEWSPEEYEKYTEGESSVLGIARQTPSLHAEGYSGESASGTLEVTDPNLKSEFYEWLSKGGILRGDTNLDNYGGSLKGVINQLSSNFGGTGIRDTFTDLEREYQNFDNLVKAWKKSGFKGAVAQLFHTMNENVGVPIQSEAIVPAINRLIDSIPVVSLFTKQKYSIELNKNTYKSETVYNKAINYRAEALKIYEGGMYGIYWYAKFYANHGLPVDMQPYVLGRLTGNPEYSRPTPQIFHQGVKEYISVIADAYDTARPAEMVNLMDFTTSDMVNPFKQVFTKKRTIPVINKDSGIVENVKVVDIPMKQTRYYRTDHKRGDEHEHDAVIRFDQISPKFNSGLTKKVNTKVTDKSNTPTHITSSSKTRSQNMFRGWAEYEIETLGGVSKTTAGAIYVDPRMWGEFEQLEAGVKINSLKDYINYQTELAEKLNDATNKEMKYGDIYYGYYPYKWSQVFENFEISSNGNWNVALSEFTEDMAEWSMFVPKDRPTYGKWHYMPIIGYEFMDKDLNSTSISVSESLNLQIPNAQQFVSTLQMTFVDDRYDRIFNWFTAYVNSIYGPFDTYVKPYKNCCLRCVIDILDWDRTILKRMKYAIIPSHFTQQYIGEADHSYKTVSVTFSVVGEIPDKTWKPQ